MRINICPIKLLSRNRERIVKNTPVAAILCSSYKINESDYAWLSSKILEFDDINTVNSQRAFTPQIANDIRTFVDALPQDCALYICCDSGESRSSAIAAATYRYLHKDEMIVWKDPRYHPNLLVYELQCEAYGISLSRVQLIRRRMISRWAFRKAILASRYS